MAASAHAQLVTLPAPADRETSTTSRADALYGQVFRRVFQPLWESGLRRRPTLSLLHALEQTQWASRETLEALQLGALRRLLAHARENVPFYQERLAGLEIDDLGSLARIPLLTRAEAAASFETRRSTRPPLPSIKKSTSGSSGSPLAFAYDPGSEYWRQAVKLRGYAWAGCRPGDPTFHYWGATQKLPRARRAKIAMDRALRRETYVDCGRRGERELLEAVRTLERTRPRTMVCYTQAGVDLARFVIERNLRSWQDIPVICGAEPLYPQDRRLLKQAFGPVFETYGSREVMLMAAETEAHSGMLVPMENLILEILVREPDGRMRPARPGETGEVAVTDLHNFGMPFIRYLNGDLATAGPAGKSPCGRAHQRITSIEGRATDVLIGKDGSRVSGMIFIVYFAAHGQSAKSFQAIQHKDGSIDLLVVPGPAFSGATVTDLVEVVDKYLPAVPFQVHTVDEIPLTPAGKRRVVVVE